MCHSDFFYYHFLKCHTCFELWLYKWIYLGWLTRELTRLITAFGNVFACVCVVLLFRMSHFIVLVSIILIVCTSRWTHDAIKTLLLRRNDIATSPWCNNDVFITSCLRWDMMFTNLMFTSVSMVAHLPGMFLYSTFLWKYWIVVLPMKIPLWWRHQIKTFSVLLDLWYWSSWYFLWSAPEQTAEQTIETPVIWDTTALIMMSL